MTEFINITTLTVTSGHRLMPGDDHVSDEWKLFLQPLVHASGFYSSVWGRCVEHPAKVLMLIVWDNRSAWSNFESSEEGHAFVRDLAEAARDPPQTFPITSFNRTIHYRGIGQLPRSAAEVHFIEFPRGSRISVGDQLKRARGMKVDITYGLDGARPEIQSKYPTLGRPLWGWVEDRGDLDGTTGYDQAIWIHTWKSPKTESWYKQSHTEPVFGEILDEKRNWLPRLPTEKAFLNGIERLGATKILAEHFKLHRFP